MLIALINKRKQTQTNKIVEKSAVIVQSIIYEINNLEKDIGESLVANYRNNKLKIEPYSEEKLTLFRKYSKRLIELSKSVYLPFSISQLIKYPDIYQVKSIVHIYTESEKWLKKNIRGSLILSK